MRTFKVTASVLSLPGDPAYNGDEVTEDKFNDAKHIDRLLGLSHIVETTSFAHPVAAPAKAAPAGKGKAPAAPVGPASTVPMETLIASATDLGIANPETMDRATLENAIAAAGQ